MMLLLPQVCCLPVGSSVFYSRLSTVSHPSRGGWVYGSCSRTQLAEARQSESASRGCVCVCVLGVGVLSLWQRRGTYCSNYHSGKMFFCNMQLLQITDCLPCIRRTHQREEETLGWGACTDRQTYRQTKRQRKKRNDYTSY